jgi:ATP-dependent Clp protease ATP-binding subunit ClpB
VIVFHQLRKEDLRQIVDIQIEHLRQRLAARRIGLELSDAARGWLADHGYDPHYGARPLKRLIQKELGDRLAMELLEGRFTEGDTIRVDAHDLGLTMDASPRQR